jgi:hypothetical protein
METIKEFSELVNSRMKAMGLTSKSLAEHIGVGKKGISRESLDKLRKGKLKTLPEWADLIAFHLEIEKGVM